MRRGSDLSRGRRAPRDAGAVVIVVALMMAMLLGFAAIVVDVGNLYRVRGELHNASDAAALAGAIDLDGTLDGIAAAKAKAARFALLHRADQDPVAVQAADVTFGHWHRDSNDYCSPAPCFQDYGTSPGATLAKSANAVRVTSRRTGATGDAVQSYFAQFLGHEESDVTATSIAVGGGPATECGFPLVVGDCSLEGAVPDTAGATCDFCLKFQDATSDNAAWTTFAGGGGVSGPAIASLIRQMCYQNPSNDNSAIAIGEDGKCSGGCAGSAYVDDEIQVGNGNGMNTSRNNFCPVIQRILRRGVQNGPAYPFTVSVPVIDSGQTGASCNPQFGGKKTIEGYATLVIYGAKCAKNDPEVLVEALPSNCDSEPNWPPPSGKYIIAALKCDLDSNSVAGGGFFGTDARRVRLVQ